MATAIFFKCLFFPLVWKKQIRALIIPQLVDV
jgi:hypothetical protein